MANIGTAIVAIVADSNPFEKSVRQMEGISGRAGAGAASSFSDRFSDGMGRAGARAGGFLRKGILVATAGVTAALTRSLIGGFRRMTTIEDATAVLTRQLGSAEEAAALLGKTLEVVQGTPFNLDQFAEATSRLVTANIELDKIPAVLTAIGESAAASGRGSEGVDQIVEAFGRMGTMATLSLREVRTLERLGVPALKILANQAGISADEMAKRISSGAVSSREAIEDLTEGILKGTGEGAEATASLAGSMEALREQTSGSLGGISAAMDRFGERVLTAFRDAGENGNNFARIFGGISETIDVLTDKMGSKLEELAEGPGLEGVVAFFENLPDRVAAAFEGGEGGGNLAKSLMSSIVDGFEKIPIDEIAGALVRVFTRATVAFAGVAGEIVTILTVSLVSAAPQIVMGFITGLMQAFAANPLQVGGLIVAMGLPGIGTGITAFLAGMFKPIPIVGPMMSAMIKGMGWVSQRIVPLIGKLGLAFVKAAPLIIAGILKLGAIIGGALTATIAGLPVLVIAAIVLALAAIGIAIFAHREKIGAALLAMWDVVVRFFTESVPRFFTETIPQAFMSLVSAIGDFFAGIDWVGILNRAFELLVIAIGLSIARIPIAIFAHRQKIADAFIAIWEFITQKVPEWIGGVISAVVEWFGTMGSRVLEAITNGFQAVVQWFTELPGKLLDLIVGFWDMIFDWGRTALNKAWEGITTAAVAVWTFFRELPGRVMDFIVSLPGRMLEFGKNILNSMWDGIKDIWNSVAGWLGGMPERIGDFFKNAGRWLVEAGKAVIRGFWDGLKAIWRNVEGWLRERADSIRRLKGPLDKDRMLLVPAGRAIMEGLNAGMERGVKDVLTTAAGVGPALERAIGKTAPFNPLSAAGGDLTAGGLPGGRPAIPMTNITVNVDSQDPEVIARAIGFEVARGSRR